MIALGVIGHGRYAQALRDHEAPLGRVHVSACAAAVDGSDSDQVSAFAEWAGVAMRSWQSVASDPDLPALLVLGPAATRAEVVAMGLARGKIVLCPGASGIASPQGTGVLLGGGEITHSTAGRHGLQAMQAPGFGAMRSLYLSIHQPRGGQGCVIEALGAEALDFVLRAVPGPFSRVRVTRGHLFGTDCDTAVLLLRSESDVVVTIELARCLPASLPAPGLGEVEIDAMGAAQSVRITPAASAVQVHTDTGRQALPWQDAPILAMLHDIERAVDSPVANNGFAHATRLFGLLERCRA